LGKYKCCFESEIWGRPNTKGERMGKDQHVVRHEKGWAVKGTGNERASGVFGTQAEAIEAGKRIATNQGADLVVHGRDGRIRSKDSYGRDPLPPRDREH
jgi:hypothetical protein